MSAIPRCTTSGDLLEPLRLAGIAPINGKEFTRRGVVPARKALPMPQQHILVVDDEASVRGVMVALLERSGYGVTAASGAAETLHHLQDHPACSLVLCDIMMPDVDGLSLLDMIVKEHPCLPVVIFSAVHDIHVATNAFRRGAVDFLLKPFERTQLLSVVGRAIEHGALLRQNNVYRQNLDVMIHSRTQRLRETMLDLEKSYDITLQAMGDALDLRDADTEGHSRRVTAYAIALAREIGVKSDQLRVIARGAFLHDIGKIATPDCILLKPGKLDPDETAVMREHCRRGYEMVRKIPFLREASEIVFAHQESFDGSGYPRGLCGEEIPLGARIFAIADTLDAITSDRPYRQGRSFEKARDEIARCSGRQFDPAIVDVFLRMSMDKMRDLRDEVDRGSHAVHAIAV